MTRSRTAARLGIGLALALAASACVRKENGTGCLPLAPESRRVDRAAPVFSRPTEITNPLFPIAQVTQTLQLGTVDGQPFRAEVTLLPGTRAITWDGRQVPTRIHQYVAYSGGRILEVALDWYAQADDGSVWYFGEDVFNYEDGVVADTHGTWLAGKDGPPGMIMPASPTVAAATWRRWPWPSRSTPSAAPRGRADQPGRRRQRQLRRRRDRAVGRRRRGGRRHGRGLEAGRHRRRP